MQKSLRRIEKQLDKNTTLSRLFNFGERASPFFQPKLRVNTPGDAYEQEADQVAEQVMRMREGDAPLVQRMPLASVAGLQRKCAECEKEEKEKVQRKESGGGDAGGHSAPPIVSDVLSSGGGKTMDGGTRQFMESRFGQDFGQVRIHTDGKAAESAAAIQARAYTSGRDVVFGAGEYQPESESGKRLLAHELVHVGQQGEGNIQRKQSLPKEKVNPSGHTIEQFITIVKKIEKNKPDWTPRQVLESLHNIAGTNDETHRRLMKTQEGNALLGIIDAKEILVLGEMLLHSDPKDFYEKGVVKDDTGQNLALSHVLTGVGAGLNRREVTPAELKDGLLPAIGDAATAGSNIDNLYTETIAGDLGQSAVFYNDGKQNNLIGEGTEATDAELAGDIDGYLIGANLASSTLKNSFGTGKLKLSALLEDYYQGKHKERFENISTINPETLKEETQDFADNYAYNVHGIMKGAFTEVGSESDLAVDQYLKWLKTKRESAKNNNVNKKGPVQNGKVSASGLHIRVYPFMSATVTGMYFKGDSIQIIKQVKGSMVEGNDVWYQTDKGFVSSQYVSTASQGNKTSSPQQISSERSEEFNVTVKSYINTIGMNTGFINCPSLLDPISADSNMKLRTLALATDAAFHEDPKSDAKDKSYRLYTSKKFKVFYNANEIIKVEVSPISTDVGKEGFLQPPDLIVFNDSHKLKNSLQFGFAWAGKGRPHLLAEPAFQGVCSRASVYIWHSISGNIELLGGRPAVTIINLLDSKFPSDKVFVNGVERTHKPQGPFKLLWNSHPSDPFMVE